MAEETKNKEYVLVKVPTGEALAFQNPEGEILSTEQLLVVIANNVDKIKNDISS